MIKFFRKIRQNLLSEGKTGNYLKYAVGEIILLVIEILIALQINNWKENRKIRILEIETLVEIKDALAQDTLVISKNLELISSKIKDGKVILKHIESKKPYHPKLDTLMMQVYYHNGYYTFNTPAF